MHKTDLEKLRRFSLAVGLTTLIYSLAGISMLPDPSISITGLNFKILRPGLLPICLSIASIYVLIRFYYYGFMLNKSPCRVRRDLIDSLISQDGKLNAGNKKVPTYLGPTIFRAHDSFLEQKEAQAYIDNFPQVFPKCFGAQTCMKIDSFDAFVDEGETLRTTYEVEIVIPVKCKLSAIIQDIDYLLPLLLNSGALITFFYFMILKRIW
jgi:hypothetical protein